MADAAPPRIDIVFFDLGGTLLEERQFDVWLEVADRSGIALDPDHLSHAYEEVKRETDAPVGRPTLEEFWRKVLARASDGTVPPTGLSEFLRGIGSVPPNLRLFSDARRCLEEVEALGLRRGVISNSRSEEGVRDHLARAGILEGLDPIVSSGTEGVSKPSPELFRRASDRARVPASRCFYVGDLANTDAKAAMSAGFRAVWLNREGTGFGDDPPEITSLTELPGYLQLAGLVVSAPVK